MQKKIPNQLIWVLIYFKPAQPYASSSALDLPTLSLSINDRIRNKKIKFILNLKCFAFTLLFYSIFIIPDPNSSIKKYRHVFLCYYIFNFPNNYINLILICLEISTSIYNLHREREGEGVLIKPRVVEPVHV